ncbi:unnamed protein product [Rotaria sordida]|uniref:Uncharacterized protein n=1 Tax=Rotaria sordida TaxID=392033 RepID=A0A818L570_9BILA|nr:unnamed protein product [Rotaria sordida]CAF0944397.1 unnamed protein product [Rotaria sordida]CAF3564517.1 unnamed protein product [Rotaria sordida]CAF3976745.1 unnamed protein product [Rotaria sordida]
MRTTQVLFYMKVHQNDQQMESSTVNIVPNSLNLIKRYQFDKKDVTTSIGSSESSDQNNDDDQFLLMNKRYHFDKRYRFD